MAPAEPAPPLPPPAEPAPLQKGTTNDDVKTVADAADAAGTRPAEAGVESAPAKHKEAEARVAEAPKSEQQDGRAGYAVTGNAACETEEAGAAVTSDLNALHPASVDGHQPSASSSSPADAGGFRAPPPGSPSRGGAVRDHKEPPLLQSHDRYSPRASKDPEACSGPTLGIGEHYRWREAELPRVRPEAGQNIRVFCGVWNLHGKKVPEGNIGDWLPFEKRGSDHHIYVIGTCECEQTAKQAMVWANKARWEQQVRDNLGEDFFLVGAHTLSAIHIMVFVHRHLWRYCWDIKTGQVATGWGNVMGNKGGVQVGFSLGATKLLFINAHLAAHQNKMEDRTNNFSRILKDSPLKQSKASSGVHDEYDRVFFMGDLNVRVAMPRDEVDKLVDSGRWTDGNAILRKSDQLYGILHGDGGPARTNANVGLWPSFQEAPIAFPPTYKLDSKADTYDSSKKKRVPSWTDRILWKADDCVKSLAYTSVPSLKISDHRPIFGQYEIAVDLNWEGPDTETAQRGASTASTSSICVLQ